MNTAKITLAEVRKIANKHDLVWNKLGDQWVVEGIPAHYSIKTERDALIDYLAKWGQSTLSEEDYANVCL